ncbi:hypothetical protein KBZ21_41465, partial [Streptomyces sp. A73]|nr:hypothetical protein [Streptomyces sp. A73]
EPEGVVHAELVDDAHLPAPLPTAAPPRPVVDQHTILAPGDPLLDPVRATRAWLDVLHQLDVHDGAFIRALTREGRLQSRIT